VTMATAPKKTPPPNRPGKTPPPTRTAVKVKSTRTAVKVERVVTPVQDIFDGLAPPGGKFEEADLSSLSPASISPEDLEALKRHNFLLWACTSGIKVDHKPFDIDSHKYLIPMYLDRAQEFVLMKSAQMGATIFVLLKIFWFCLYRSAKACFFFPTQDGVNLLSKDRLTPLVQSNAQLIEAVQDTDTIGYKKIGKESALYLRHLGGVASKDSTPFDFIAFDEVRLLPAQDIDQAYERISHSIYKMIMHVSTAGYPHADIHRRFLEGTQNYWHTKCNCFPLCQKIIARKIGSLIPEAVGLDELRTTYTQYEALSWNLHHKIWQYKPITKFHDNGVKSIIEATFRNGAKVGVTEDHPFFQHAGRKHARTKAVPIGEIPIATTPAEQQERVSSVLVAREIPNTGSHVGFQKGQTAACQTPWDNLTLYAIGAYVAEGSWKANTWINFAQIEGKPLRDAVLRWAGLNNLPVNEVESGVDVSITSRPDLIRLFEECNKGCQNKRFPSAVMLGSKDQINVAMEGYLAGDGHRFIRDKDGRGYDSSRQWSCCTTSFELKDQLVFLGLRLGTPLYVTYRESEGKRPAWELQYNPESHFNKPRLGKLSSEGSMSTVSIKSREPAGQAHVGCISVADNENFVLADSGLLVHNCPDGVILSDCWPDCVAITDEEIYYRCPRCKTRINDPQNGRFVQHNPGAHISSYHIHQMMSRYISPSEVWRAWQTTQNIKEFYNAKLGKPYVDEENVPVTTEDLIASENPEVVWGPAHSKISQIAMGVDQMSGVNYVVIAERTETKKRIIHYEIIDSMNPLYMEAGQRITPFKRLYQLMKDYRVNLCIIDAMPNANEAMDFARAFPKRVFVAWYLDSRGTQRDIVQWGDRPKEKLTTRRGGPKIKFKYTCILNRYLSIDFALSEIGNHNCEWGHPDRLVQTARGLESGRYEPQALMRTYFYLHMTKIIRQKTVVDEDVGRFRMEWVNLGMDPHTVHAWNFCNIALERLRRQPLMTFA